ncbi:hypothetical protein BH11VER1_BH11VER1_04060 [soil metagenome]
MKTTPTREKKNSGGRPPKFEEPSRPVTVTLPESTLEGLRQIDPDRGQAIVKLTQSLLSEGRSAPPLVEVVKMASKTGLLVVGPSEALRRIPFLRLVEVAPARFLIALESGNDFRTLEIAIQDVLEDIPESNLREHKLMLLLLENIRRLRKSDRVSMAEILLVNLDDDRRTSVTSIADNALHHVGAWLGLFFTCLA